MLRILRKTTLFAAALVTSLGLIASSANAQELSDCPPNGVRGPAAPQPAQLPTADLGLA